MQIKNGVEYESVYARAAAYFLGTCAPRPNEATQAAAYDLITEIYYEIAKDPTVIGVKTIEDVWFDAWEQQRGREKDCSTIRKAIAKIESLIEELFHISEDAKLLNGNAYLPMGYKVSKALKLVFTSVGVVVDNSQEEVWINAGKGCFDGLKELAVISRRYVTPITDGPLQDKPFLLFTRGVFAPESNWIAQAYDRLLNADGRLIRLCEEMEKRGFIRVDCHDGKMISLDYIKQYGKKEEPLKCPWGERTHAGIGLTYEDLRLEPAFLWIRMPMYKTVLQQIENLPTETKEFLMKSTKNCDGCRYCVQTDKTHTRPLACIPIDDNMKCPLYPGFTMNWRELTSDLQKQIINLMDALDTVL